MNFFTIAPCGRKIYLRCHIQRQVPVLAFEPMIVANCYCLLLLLRYKFARFLGSAIAARLSYCFRSSSETFTALAGFPKTSSDLKGIVFQALYPKGKIRKRRFSLPAHARTSPPYPAIREVVGPKRFDHMSANEACGKCGAPRATGKPLLKEKRTGNPREAGRRDRWNRFPSPEWCLVP